MGNYERRKANEARERMRQESRDAHSGIERQSREAHSTFESSNRSGLGSGQSGTPEPAPAGGGSLELLSMTLTGLATLGAAAMTAGGIIRRRR